MKRWVLLWILLLRLPLGLAAPERGTLVFCDGVDDKWNATIPSTSARVGSSWCFLVKLKEKVNPGFVGWVIHRVGESGKDTAFVEELQMGVQPDSRNFCTTEGYAFDKPGTYRVYLIDWEKRQQKKHSGNFTDYFAKGEITITP